MNSSRAQGHGPTSPNPARRRAILLSWAGAFAFALASCGGGDGPGPTLPTGSSALYALEAGRFASRDGADQFTANIRAQGVPCVVVPLFDEFGMEWFVVAIGPFDSLEEARAQRPSLAIHLGLAHLEPMQLPLSPPG